VTRETRVGWVRGTSGACRGEVRPYPGAQPVGVRTLAFMGNGNNTRMRGGIRRAPRVLRGVLRMEVKQIGSKRE
jgi:hypothetical protein